MLPNLLKIEPYISKPVTKISPEAFEKLTRLGRGGFSKVYLVRKKDTGKLYAMKVIKRNLASKWSGELVKREFKILKDLDHPSIVKLYYSFSTKNTYNIIMDYCPLGNLYALIRKHHKINIPTILLYFAEILEVLKYLHDNKIIFRDLKAENILVDLHGHLKLTDFGLARSYDNSSMERFSYCGSPLYIAPEIVQRQVYDHSVDYYALGVLIYEMTEGIPPFNYNSSKKIKQAKIQQEVDFPLSFNPDLKEMVKKLLAKVF